MAKRPRIYVSACLLGNKVRYDGGDKLDILIPEVLGKMCELVGICPEVECGLPTPREMMRLEGEADSPRLVAVATGEDLTGQLMEWCKGRVEELERSGVHGFILKKNSPSCGLSGVKVFDGGSCREDGRGIFAEALARRFPSLPMTDEAGLREKNTWERFIGSVLGSPGG